MPHKDGEGEEGGGGGGGGGGGPLITEPQDGARLVNKVKALKQFNESLIYNVK